MHPDLRINFAIHRALLNQFVIHRDLLVTCPDVLVTFLIRHDVLVTFPNFPLEGAETSHALD